MKCSKCHHENPEESKFCNGCGHKLELTCPECGKVNPSGSRFCNGCGNALQKPSETPPIDLNRPQSYTPKHLADKILITRTSIEGERKLVTVFFADVANYTSLSERLDPEEVHQIMDVCFKILMDEIHRHEGTINQFTGDGVMALFGAPAALEDHAGRACHAALSIQKAMIGYGEKIKKDIGLDFSLRIGLNSGPVIVGAIGDDLRMDYTAVGDTTNLAARMQTSAAPGTVLVSENTYKLTRDYFEFEPLGPIDVKGKQEPQPAYTLLSAKQVTTRMGAAVTKGLTRFVGRKNSMAVLLDCFGKARSGAGQVAAIVGEAGVGKSRLLHEMRLRLSVDPVIYLEGRCLHYGSAMAYLPLLDILKAFFQIQETDREFIVRKRLSDNLRQLNDTLTDFSALEDLLSLPVTDPTFAQLEPKLKREKTFEALRDLIIRISHRTPLVLAVEDLHWIDKTSEEFIDYLIGSLARCPILLVLLYRPEYTHRWAGKSYYTQIGLDQLGPSSSAELIKAILDEGEAAPELAQLILDRAAGNPLFMEEFTHTLLENGSIEKSIDRYILKRSPSQIQVPDTIQGIIAGRMDRLEDNLKRTMQVASVIGRDFSYRILQTITGLSAELKSYLLNLQGLEFIYEKQLFPELEYIFKHALIQEVAYNSLLLKRRAEIHLKIARAVETLYAERLEEFYEVLAFHYSKSEDLEKAYHYLKLSGDKATNTYANSDAYHFYRKALTLLKEMPGIEDQRQKQIDLQEAICPPMTLSGFPSGSLDILIEALNEAKNKGDGRHLSILYSRLANYFVAMGNKIQALEYSTKGLNEAEKIGDVDLIISAAYFNLLSYSNYGNVKKVIELAPRLIELIENNQREAEFFGKPFNIYAELLSLYGYYLGFSGKFEEGEAKADLGLTYAWKINHLPTVVVVEVFFGSIYYTRGDATKLIQHAEEGLKNSTEAGINIFTGTCHWYLGYGYFLLKDFEKSIRFLEKAIDIQAKLNIQMFMSGINLCLGYVQFEIGNFEKARMYCENGMGYAQQNSDRQFEALLWIMLGRVSGKIRLDENVEAEIKIMKGIQILDELGIKPFLAQGYLYLGDLYFEMKYMEKAMKYFKMAEAMFNEMDMPYWLGKTLEALKKVK